MVHLATLSRERRKERRDIAKSAIDALTVLATEARDFHSAATFDSNNADIVIYKTQRIVRSLQRLPLSKLDLPISKMVRLRKSISLNNADLSSFSTQRTQSPILQEIRAAIDDLVDSIEEMRQARWG